MALNRLEQYSSKAYRRNLPATFVHTKAAGLPLKSIAKEYNMQPIKARIARRFIDALKAFGLGTKKEDEGRWDEVLPQVQEILIYEYGHQLKVLDIELLFDAILSRSAKVPGASHSLPMPELYGLNIDSFVKHLRVYMDARSQGYDLQQKKVNQWLAKLPSELLNVQGDARAALIDKVRRSGNPEALIILRQFLSAHNPLPPPKTNTENEQQV